MIYYLLVAGTNHLTKAENDGRVCVASLLRCSGKIQQWCHSLKSVRQLAMFFCSQEAEGNAGIYSVQDPSL